ncbi:unnamed protein product [Amaranthus hypochondriacus]
MNSTSLSLFFFTFNYSLSSYFLSHFFLLHALFPGSRPFLCGSRSSKSSIKSLWIEIWKVEKKLAKLAMVTLAAGVLTMSGCNASAAKSSIVLAV